MKIKIIDNKQFVFDDIRKKWLLLTPEEKVRQHVVQYLIQEKKIPKSLIALEKLITVNEMKKRFDVLVYKATKPWLLVECKEPNVELNDMALQQVLNYNNVLQVPYFAITNGENLFVWKIENSRLLQLNDFPNWELF
ncbi:MAG: type I restriction enzyme HsdR N-terminal domain-containing protein [Chitinophagaceae bacterium]